MGSWFTKKKKKEKNRVQESEKRKEMKHENPSHEGF